MTANYFVSWNQPLRICHLVIKGFGFFSRIRFLFPLMLTQISSANWARQLLTAFLSCICFCSSKARVEGECLRWTKHNPLLFYPDNNPFLGTIDDDWVQKGQTGTFEWLINYEKNKGWKKIGWSKDSLVYSRIATIGFMRALPTRTHHPNQPISTNCLA